MKVLQLTGQSLEEELLEHGKTRKALLMGVND